MRLPTYNELIEEQLDVMETPLNEDLFVAGPPGSGKTVLAVRRAQAVDELSNVLVITYNRMLRRLMALLGAPSASTMQSHVWKDYEARTGSPPPRSALDAYEYSWPTMLETLMGHGEAQTTHGHLVVDEGQDLAAEFFTYARRHISPVLSVFADDDQAINRHHTKLEEIKKAGDLPDPLILSVNHRNTGPISALAERFHRGRLPHATVRRTTASADRPRLIRTRGLDDTSERIANWYSSRGGSVGVIVHSNETGTAVHHQLRELLEGHRGIGIYRNADRNEEDIDLLEDGITILNAESAKGQEFDAVFLLELERFVPCTTTRMRRAMYMLCTRARDHLLLVCGPAPLGADALAELPVPLVEHS